MNRRHFMARAATVAVAVTVVGAPAAQAADPVVALYAKWSSIISTQNSDKSDADLDAAYHAADAIEQAIWSTQATTLAGILCKAKVSEHYASPGRDEPFEDKDWGEKCAIWLRQEIERISAVAGVRL